MHVGNKEKTTAVMAQLKPEVLRQILEEVQVPKEQLHNSIASRTLAKQHQPTKTSRSKRTKLSKRRKSRSLPKKLTTRRRRSRSRSRK